MTRLQKPDGNSKGAFMHTREGLLNDPFEFGVGMLALFALINTAWHVLPIIDDLPKSQRVGILALDPFMLWIWMIFGFIGTILILVGLFTSTFSAVSRAIEASGLWLSAAFWFSIGMVDAWFTLSDYLSFGGYFVLALSCIFRLHSLNNMESVVKTLNLELDKTSE